MYTVEQIRDELNKRLTEKRRNHCCYVSEWAGKIAGYDGYDVDKAILAGLLHDVAKQIPVDKLLEMALDNGLVVTTAERNNPHSLHGRVGAVISEKEFGVVDKEILAAIAYHSGRPGMGRLEKIVFLSDYMQKLFSWGVDISPIVKDNGLDAAIMKVMHHVIKYCVDKDIQDEKTFETFDAILLDAQQKVEQEATKEKIAKGKVPTPVAYFDKSYELNKKQRIRLETVQNVRELGGYRTRDGHYVKQGVLVRAGCLDNISKTDAEILQQQKFNYIIDLRQESECQGNNNLPNGIKVLHCPLSLPKQSEHQKSLVEQYYASDSAKEKSWLAAEIVRNTDIDQVYHDILEKPETAGQLRKIFDVLLRNDCKGVLFCCDSGKERTGLAVALVMTALGVDVLTIWLDYAASVVPNYSFMETFVDDLKNGGYDKSLVTKARYFNSLVLDMLRNLHKDVLSKYISLKRYLADELHLSDNDIAVLKQKFLK